MPIPVPLTGSIDPAAEPFKPAFMKSSNASSHPIRLGIVGAAADRGWARTAHIPAVHAVPSMSLHAVATTAQGSADAAATAFGASLAFGDPHAMIDHPDVDAISVVVKAPAHYELVHHALSAGKPVYCEWPLGKSIEETMALTALAADKKVLTAIGLQGRFSPWLNWVRDLIASGRIGRVLSTSLLAYDELSTGIVDSGNVYMLDAANGANPLTIHGGHFIDSVCFVLGEIAEVSAVTATTRASVTVRETGDVVPTDSPDQIALAGLLDDGSVVSIHVRGGRGGPPSAHWEIQGEDGVIRVTCAGYLHWRPLIVEVCPKGSPSWDVIDPPSDIPALNTPGHDEPFRHVANAYQSFASAILAGTLSTPGFDAALQRHRTIEGIARAARLGESQRFVASIP